VHGELAEIGPSDLRFHPDEAEALFAPVADGDLPTPAVLTLNDRLEGWPSLLGLVALRLEQYIASEARVRAPGEQVAPGSWDDVLRHLSERDIETFLIEEILASQPQEVQHLLLRISIVDAFSAELCDALLQPEMPATATPALLDRLERQQLLIESCDEAGTWYRFPRVLRDAFRRRLMHEVTPLEVMVIRRRACEWFAARDMVDEAIEQALACGDTVRVVELVDGSVESLLNQRDYPTLDLRLRKLPPELVASRPRLLLARAWILNFLNRFEAIPTVLTRLDAMLELNTVGLSPADIERLRAEAAILHALTAMVGGDARQVVTFARQAYDVIPSYSGYASGLAAGYLGIGLHFVGETDAAMALLETTHRGAPEPTDRDATVALWALAFVGLMSAKPRTVIRWAGQLVDMGPTHCATSYPWSQHLRGLAYYELNRLSEARECFLAADQHRHAAHRLSLRGALLGLAMVDHASGDLAAASDTLQAVRGLPELASSPEQATIIRTVEAHQAYALGDVEAAREILSGIGAGQLTIRNESISGSPTLVRVRVLIGLGDEDDLAEAARLLDALQTAATSINDTLQVIGVHAARALLCQARGDTDTALRFLEQSIALAAPNGLVRTFLDLGPPMQWLISELDRRSGWSNAYASHLLGAFLATGELSQPPIPARSVSRSGLNGTEALTWRETEVMRLLDARLSNQEIAGVLFISADTVKKHTINIYRKLQVTGRREAVARAYALAILPAATPGPGTRAG
jgi:LuxR family maltose regulon positive regulatory protein